MAARTDEWNYLKSSHIVAGLTRFRKAIASHTALIGRRHPVGLWRRAFRPALHASPLRACGVALVAAVLTRTALCVWLGRDFTRLGYGCTAILLMVGLAGVMTAAPWETVRQGSVVMRYVEKRRASAAARSGSDRARVSPPVLTHASSARPLSDGGRRR